MNHYFYSVVLHYQNEGRFQHTKHGVHVTKRTGQEAFDELESQLRGEHSDQTALRKIQFIAFNPI